MTEGIAWGGGAANDSNGGVTSDRGQSLGGQQVMGTEPWRGTASDGVGDGAGGSKRWNRTGTANNRGQSPGEAASDRGQSPG